MSPKRLGWLSLLLMVCAAGLLWRVTVTPDNAAVPAAAVCCMQRTMSPGVTYLLTGLSAVAGAFSVAAGLLSVRRGWRPRPLVLTALGLAVAGVLAVLLPVGTADIGSYVAYGQMEATGVDSYAHSPGELLPTVRADANPRVSEGLAAAEDPWINTPNVYGPVATWIFEKAARAGHDSPSGIFDAIHRWAFAAFALTGLMLLACARTTEGKVRAALLWTCNPLLQLHLVSGAHVDVFVAFFVVLSVWLTKRPILRGAASGLAVATKMTAGWAALGLVLGKPRRGRWRRLTAFVLVAGLLYAAASEHVFDQSRKASRYVSAGTPWRWMASFLELIFSHSLARALVVMMALAATIALSFAITVRLTYWPDKGTAERAARSALIPMLAWTLMAPYQLPWYDAVVWALLAASVAMGIDWLILLHTAVLTLAYLPGRLVELGDGPQAVQTFLRSGLSPVVVAFCAVACVWSLKRPQTSPVGDRM